MKVTFALQVVLMPCMWVHAALYKETKYSSSTCDATTETETSWNPSGICWPSDGGFAMANCVNGAMEYTVYTDSTCGTVDIAKAAPYSNGVYTLPSGCQNEGNNEGKMIDCSAAQPSSISILVYTDSGCTQPHPSYPTMMKAINECEWETKGGSNSVSGNMTGGGRRLSERIEGKKMEWDASTSQATEKQYSDKTCTTQVGSPSVKNFGNNACLASGDGNYLKVASTAGTASGCDRMQSLFLLPLLVFLGVAKMIML